MPFHKICTYEPCSKPFTCVGSTRRYCCISCGSKARTLTASEDIKAYFLRNVVIPGNDLLNKEDCWPWSGSLNDSGYGMAFVRNEKIRAHRLGYEIFIGPIPDGLDMLHGSICKIRHCASPWHIRPGTNLENAQDRVEFGAQVKGSAHNLAKHTETKVLHILQEFHDKGLSIDAIRKKRRMKFGTLHDIIYRVTWKHVAPGLYPAPADQRAQITKEMVEKMRYLREHDHWSYRAIAEKFVVKYPIVVDICTYATWKKVGCGYLPVP